MKIDELFDNHVSNCSNTNEFTHFLVGVQRFVRCEKCNRIVSTNDCLYYGGEQLRMFLGGCRSCFGKVRK